MTGAADRGRTDGAAGMAYLNTRWALAIVQGLAEGGVETACVCPGSRSTPLALAIDAHPAIRIRSVLDERSAGFFAVGHAKATRRPASIVTTSGTAVAELLPAVVEAHEARVPLVVVSADRPAEVRGTGANQTIDQARIYAPFLRWGEDLPAPEEARLAGLSRRTREAVAAAWLPPAGPVHLNVPLRKPLEPDPRGQEALAEAAGQEPPRRIDVPEGLEDVGPLPDLGAPEGLIVVGPRPPDGLRTEILGLAADLGVPVLADGLADLRFGPGGPGVVSTADLILGDAALARRLRPDWVLQFGASPTSKGVRHFLGLHGSRRFRVDEALRGRDDIPGRVQLLRGDARAIVERLREMAAGSAGETASGVTRETASGSTGEPGSGGAARGRRRTGAPSAPSHGATRESWTQAWAAMDAAAREALSDSEAASPGAETAIVPCVLGVADRIFVGNSLPVRDLERFGGAHERPVTVWANRGASGIDGTIATPAGIAQAAGPTIAVIGDVAFQHDIGSLALLHDDVRIVVVDNGGGRIFQHLPIASHARFSDLFLTPPRVAIDKACAAFGIEHELVEGEGLDEALRGGAQVVQVRTDAEAAVQARNDAVPVAAAAARAALERTQPS